jgi:hypothetical protein
MERTRVETDAFTSIKIPMSLKRQLRILAAQKDKYVYQIIAELVYREAIKQK